MTAAWVVPALVSACSAAIAAAGLAVSVFRGVAEFRSRLAAICERLDAVGRDVAKISDGLEACVATLALHGEKIAAMEAARH
ncbi:MAG: hypothetical protein K6C36_04490 [Clostridia bacterium]|nr:hypothetical protein [Clostridia bacterium]